MSAQRGLANWHRVFRGGGKAEELRRIVRADAVFHSPVVHTPQEGRDRVVAYLAAASETLSNASFAYVRELTDGDDAMLEFTTEMDGVMVNGIDLIRFDEDGMIRDFKVMIRPLKAVNKVWEAMAAQLAAARD